MVFVVWLMLSRYGSVKLGPNDSKPEYSTLSWFAMLFTAGMGIGLVFYAVSEPVYHFREPARPARAARPRPPPNAMNYTFYHWGLHPWAIYIVLGARARLLHVPPGPAAASRVGALPDAR